MKAPLFDIKGKQKGTVDLEATHFGVTPNMGLMHRLLILQQANGRIAIAHAKHSSKKVLVMLVWVIVGLLCVVVEVSSSDLATSRTGQFL